MSLAGRTRQPISISAVFPCYNDGGTIGSVVVTTLLTLRRVCTDYEVVVVDDGSTDYSRDVLRKLEADHPELRVIYHDGNRGYGAALKTAFSSATKDFVFYTDGDAQYDVRELEILVSALNPNIDVVQGYKLKRHDPLHRIVIGLIYQHLMRFVFALKIWDVDCDFRLMRRSLLQSINLRHNSGVICVELVRKLQVAGARFCEVPVHHYFRTYGKSQFFNYPRLLRVARDLIFLWWDLMVRGNK